MKKITITVGSVSLLAELNDSPTAQEIWDILPVTTSACTWGNEVYFTIPVVMPEASDACATVDVGTVAYWPMRHALCVFYGPTPSSQNDRPRAYSPVNIVGRILDDAQKLHIVREGVGVRVTRAD